jgi:hypothetical protein
VLAGNLFGESRIRVGAATSGTGCLTRVIRANRCISQVTPQPNNSGRPPHQAQTIDYLDQRCVDCRDRSHWINWGSVCSHRHPQFRSETEAELSRAFQIGREWRIAGREQCVSSQDMGDKLGSGHGWRESVVRWRDCDRHNSFADLIAPHVARTFSPLASPTQSTTSTSYFESGVLDLPSISSSGLIIGEGLQSFFLAATEGG